MGQDQPVGLLAGELGEMMLGGWSRLYVFLLLLVSVPSFVIWAFQRPTEEKSWQTYSCEYPYWASSSEAKDHLGRNDFREHDYASEPRCANQLRDIATGERLRQDQQRWRESFKWGAIFIGVLFGLIYAIGWGMGWVWRGFRQNKSPG